MRARIRSPLLRAGARLAVCLLAACAATHPGEAPRAPKLVPELVHYAGSPLAGAAASEAGEFAADPAQSYSVRARLYVLAHPAGQLHRSQAAAPDWKGGSALFTPLSIHTRLVAAFRGDEPIRPSADLGLAARLSSGESARAWAGELATAGAWERTDVAELAGSLPQGATVSLALRAGEALEVPGEGALRGRIALEIARSAAGLETALVREELVRDAGQTDARAPRVLLREYGALDLAPQVDGPPLVLELQRPPGDPGSAPLVWVVEVSSAAPDAKLHAQALAQIAESSHAARARRARVEREEAHGREIDDAFGALRNLRAARSALVFLAGSTGADLAGDFALVADDEALVRFVGEVLGSVPDAQSAARGGATLGFVLEKQAWSFVSRGMDEKPLAPEYLGLLVRNGGELARSAGAIEDVLASVGDLDGLRARVVQENRDALEDASPAVRVRACDFLAARGVLPAGFDPLASLAERRKALAAAEDAAGGAK